MKNKLLLSLFAFFISFYTFGKKENEKILAPTVTLTTEPLAAENIAVANTIYKIYTLKVFSTEAFLLNGISFKIDGTFTSGNIIGATLSSDSGFLKNISTSSLVAGGVINFTGLSQSILSNSPRFIHLSIQLSSTCPAGRIIKVDGSANPATLTSTASTLTTIDNQTDIAGPFTTVTPTLILTSEATNAFTAPIGSTSQLLYIMKIINDYSVSSINQVKVKFAGTFLAGDVSSVNVSLSSNPTPSGVGLYTNSQSATTLTSGNILTISTSSWVLNPNSTNYLLVRVDISNTASAGRTLKINGADNPISFTNPSVTPTIVNNQTDISGALTIVNPEITINTETTPNSNVLQNDFARAYVLKVTSTTGAVIKGINIPLEGTFLNSDMSSLSVYIANAPNDISGTSIGGPYTISGSILSNSPSGLGFYNLAANTTKYIIFRPKFAVNAINGHTIKVNGVTNPPTIITNSGTIITNNQTDLAGELTIKAPYLTVTTEPLSGTTTNPGTGVNIYKFKLTSDEGFAFNQINMKVDGSFTAGKLSNYLTKTSGDILTMPLASNYFLPANTPTIFTFTVNTSNSLPDGYTLKVDGVNNLFSIGGNTFKTPVIINNQTDIAGTQTIQASLPQFVTGRTASITNIIPTEKTAYSAEREIITTIKADPQISGTTNCIVWPTGGISIGYVPRHYEINVPAASSGATATVTLYFSQSEFNEYNNNDVTDFEVPTAFDDLTGKANLRIYKFPGASTAGSNGLTYSTTTPLEINPDDSKIIFQNGRWEVTFEVTGFSGFFVGAVSTPLPLNLITFTAKPQENQIHLTWQTTNETNFSHFEIQKSENGKEFGAIGKVIGNQSSIYNFTDTNSSESQNYYKLKMVDLNGTSSFSKTISVNFEKNGYYLSVENPAKNGEFLIRSNYKKPQFTLLNSLGQKIPISIMDLPDNQHKIKAKTINSGIYFLMIESEGELVTRKVLID